MLNKIDCTTKNYPKCNPAFSGAVVVKGIYSGAADAWIKSIGGIDKFPENHTQVGNRIWRAETTATGDYNQSKGVISLVTTSRAFILNIPETFGKKVFDSAVKFFNGLKQTNKQLTRELSDAYSVDALDIKAPEVLALKEDLSYDQAITMANLIKD